MAHKKIFFIILFIVAFIVLIITTYNLALRYFSSSIQPCPQVIVYAQNPDTKEIKEFSNPCKIPNGWERVEMDPIEE